MNWGHWRCCASLPFCILSSSHKLEAAVLNDGVKLKALLVWIWMDSRCIKCWWLERIVNRRYRGMVKCLTPKMLAIASLSNCMYCFLVVVRVLLVNAIGSEPSFIWWLPCHKGMHRMPTPVACLHQSVQGGWKTLVLSPWSRILVVHVSTYMGFHLQEMMEWGQGS